MKMASPRRNMLRSHAQVLLLLLTLLPLGTCLLWDDHNATIAPGNHTSNSNSTNVTTVAPTVSPSNHTTIAPTPSNETNHTTVAPTPAPTAANHTTSAPSMAPDDEPHMSFLKILSKTIAWLILIGLSVVAFGAVMSHRYRIYFFARGVWYTILRLPCSVWVRAKVFGRGNDDVDGSLNTIIFDNEMNQGLLMQENE